jgi:hypothetical protein
LGTESGHTRTGNVGQPSVICICNDAEQLFDTMASDRRDDPFARTAGGSMPRALKPAHEEW